MGTTVLQGRKHGMRLLAAALLAASSMEAFPERTFAADDYSKTESFEAAALPSTWSVENGGTKMLSSKHYKHGSQSMQWTWSNGSKLRDTQPANLATANVTNGGMKLWIYNENPVNDQVTFNFGKTTEINSGIFHYTFKVNLNFKGWRAVWVRFRAEGMNPAYTQNLNEALETMQIVPPASVPSGSLYFDNLEFSPSMVQRRSADYQMPKPGISVGGSTWDNVYYYSQQQPTIPLPATITQQETDGFNAISTKYEKWVYGDALQYANLSGPLKARYDGLQKFIRNGLAAYNALHIVRHPGGSITGEALYANADPHSPKFGDNVSKTVLLPLVLDYKINGNATSKQKVLDVLDYMNDQGWAEGSSIGTQDHETNNNSGYFHAVYLMRNELKAAGIFNRELNTIFWYANFGKTFDNSVYVETTADEMRTKFMYDLLYVLGMDNTPKKVQYMKGLVGLYEQALQIAPGLADTIKPDGTLFHHQGVYLNAYGDHAIHTTALIAYFLSGTPYALSDSVFNNIKKALLTLELASNKYVMPVGATGRFPAATSPLTSLQGYAYLAMAKTPIDTELASTFMRLWDPQSKVLQGLFRTSDSYGVEYLDTLGGLQLADNLATEGFAAKANPQGFWVMPYGAMAVNRINDRLVGIKGWSYYAWDFEAADNQNIYGRYQSYGNMQILQNGLTSGIVESGINVENGWDWSRWPGTTVKHLSLTELALTNGRMNSYSDSKFVGGVSSQNKYGVFAMKLHDTIFDPSLRANKSVFFFGDKIVSLGSDIQNTDSAHNTETTLFQSYMPSTSMPFWFNSTTPVVSATYTSTITSPTPAWIVDPYGNGYVLPNASGTVITRGVQNSMNNAGTKNTSGNYTTAYINHGTAPASAGYEYAIKIAAGAQGTANFANNTQYTVLQKNSNAHVVKNTEPGKDMTGYAIFNSSVPVNQGLIRSSSDPIIAMVHSISTKEAVLSVADPDLRIATELTPSAMKKDTLILNGKWRLKAASNEARVISTSGTTTTVEFDTVHGKSIDITLVK
ncbi:chondroitin sulfate ABC lyase [Paenibacillus marchantiophytorum]|uniref:Chondroitin sulfate ABC lyase n=1 Tax=Paenibacillus marchantiophytorum TaxID=1619310 RepID=A0ABQ1EXU0_9BACL|nr:chondroitinase family polysaccharide lyase [Paenibacillus marchantiophytorum]GFZ90850.1 chondroitin sulfate ABC lyase [Paenibacillus marchantiophytorum]